jgi:predicted NBD/HSP70 family sugar kinase
VNLAAVAEHRVGAATDRDDFVLLWVGRGIGVAIVLGGRLYRGASGGAGEVGYLPVPGAPLPSARRGRGPLRGGLQSLVGAEAVRALARDHGFRRRSAEDAIRAASESGERGQPLLDEFAARLAVGVAAVCAVLDPGLVVITGDVVRAAGDSLAPRIAEQVAAMSPLHPDVRPSGIEGNAVLRGALLTAVAAAREQLFDSTADDQDALTAARPGRAR